MARDNTRRAVGAAVGVALVFGVGVGFWLRGGTGAGSAPARPSAASSTAVVGAAAGPSAIEAGVPVGFAPTEAGAIAAASTMAGQLNALFAMEPADRAAAMARYAVPERADALVTRLEEHAASFREIAAIAPEPEVISAVIRAGIDTYDGTRAGVTLYLCQILMSDAMQVPMATFLTGRYELVWVEGDWRVWSVLDTPGPTPLASPDADPTDTARFRAELPKVKA